MLIVVVNFIHLLFWFNHELSSGKHFNDIHMNSTQNVDAYFKRNDTVLDQVKSVTDADIDNEHLLFVHIPKSGGTTFTSLLRKIQCVRNSAMNADCCHLPGSCYIKGQRRCVSIIGCVSHHPRR